MFFPTNIYLQSPPPFKKDGHVPLLSSGKKYHFFLSKHEKRKHIALQISKALQDIGFKVWISQDQAALGNAIDKEAMQQGIRESESILLCMTKGIFHRDRVWVTETEVSYGIAKCGCPLICVVPVDDENTFDFDTKCPHQLHGHVHLKECCQDVAEDFQYMAKTITAAIDFSPWLTRGGAEDVQKCVEGIVKRYLVGESALKMLHEEIILQRSLQKCPSKYDNEVKKEEEREEKQEEKQKQKENEQRREKWDGNEVEIEGIEIVEWKS